MKLDFDNLQFLKYDVESTQLFDLLKTTVKHPERIVSLTLAREGGITAGCDGMQGSFDPVGNIIAAVVLLNSVKVYLELTYNQVITESESSGRAIQAHIGIVEELMKSLRDVVSLKPLDEENNETPEY